MNTNFIHKKIPRNGFIPEDFLLFTLYKLIRIFIVMIIDGIHFLYQFFFL